MKTLNLLLDHGLLGFELLWLFHLFLLLFLFLLFHQLVVLDTLLTNLRRLLALDGKYQRLDIGLLSHVIVLFQFYLKKTVLFLLQGLFVHSFHLFKWERYFEVLLGLLDLWLYEWNAFIETFLDRFYVAHLRSAQDLYLISQTLNTVLNFLNFLQWLIVLDHDLI